jgi:transposase
VGAHRIPGKARKSGAWLAFVAAANIEAGVKNKPPTTQLTVKAILNRVQRFPGFVYRKVVLHGAGRDLRIEVHVEAHAGMHCRCGKCLQPCPGYDTLAERSWLFVPLWNIPVWLHYAPRRVECPTDGVVVEHLPWSEGKRPIAKAMLVFLAQWARRLSWLETARVFRTSWEAVYRSVEWFVEWGLAHRELNGVTAIGVDEIHRGKGKRAHNFFTLIYQLDAGCRRLLWVGPKRTQASLRAGLESLGPAVLRNIRWVCSDMWQPYLQVVARKLGHAWQVLDRFHIVGHLNQAVDQVRRAECVRLRGSARGQRLKRMRWRLLKKHSRVRGHARRKLYSLVHAKLATGKAWILKEVFQKFWTYRSPFHARLFLRAWCTLALRSRLDPMKKVARTLRHHEGLLLNWFRAKGQLSSGAVEGMNNKIRVITRRSYGFRTDNALVLALYHNLGHLPEPKVTHEFC